AGRRKCTSARVEAETKKPAPCGTGLFGSGTPNGIRTRVSTLRGWCPRPLDDGSEGLVGGGGRHQGLKKQGPRGRLATIRAAVAPGNGTTCHPALIRGTAATDVHDDPHDPAQCATGPAHDPARCTRDLAQGHQSECA